jgi:hypothetical protein
MAVSLIALMAGPLLNSPSAWASQTDETYDAYANGGAGEVIASNITSFTLDNITYTTDVAVESGVYTSATNNGNVDDAPLSTGATDGVLMLNDTGNAPMTEVTISLADGDPMNVTSFDFDEGLSNGTIYLIPDGNTANELTLSGSQLSGLVNLSAQPQFRAITSLEILDSGDSGNFTPTLNNFTYTDLSSPPVLTTDSGSASFTAGDNTASTPVAVDSGIGLTDGDSTTASSATVAVTGNFHSGQDVLAFTNTDTTTYGNILASYNATSGVLTLSSSGSSATIAQWQAALEAVTYTDTAITPNNATRTVSFSLTDANSNTSNTATRTVTVADTDQTPVVTTTGGTTSFTIPYGSSPAPVAVDPGTVSDLDNATLPSATVTINGGFQTGGDVLGFTNNGSTMGNIVGSYDATTGILALSSLGATATLTQWQVALAAVTYTDTATNASTATRTVVFVVDDGTTSSTPSDKSISVTKASPPVQPQASTTSTALSASANPAMTGVQVIYTATVKPVPDAGTVTFTDGASPIQGCSGIDIDATSGTATCGISYASAGARTIQAAYSGDGEFASSNFAFARGGRNHSSGTGTEQPGPRYDMRRRRHQYQRGVRLLPLCRLARASTGTRRSLGLGTRDRGRDEPDADRLRHPDFARVPARSGQRLLPDLPGAPGRQ